MIPPVLDKAVITSGFDDKRSYGKHGGYDYINESAWRNQRNDRRLVACEDGVVTHVDFSLRARYSTMCGCTLEIRFSDDVVAKLCHLKSTNVKVGQKVHKGMLIGVYGNSGTLSFGKHCHIQFRRHGVLVDPVRLINEPAIKEPIKEPVESNKEYMHEYEEGMALLFWEYPGRDWTPEEKAKALSEPHTREQYLAYKEGFRTADGYRKRIERMYKKYTGRTTKSGHGLDYVEKQIHYMTPASRIQADLDANGAEFRKR